MTHWMFNATQIRKILEKYESNNDYLKERR